MPTHGLLAAWPQARFHPELWRRYLDEDLDDPVSAVSAALLDPHTPDRMITTLLEARAWLAAELLLDDELFLAGLPREHVDRWHAQINGDRATALVEWRARKLALTEQAEFLDPGLADRLGLTSYNPGSDGQRDQQELDRLERALREALDAIGQDVSLAPARVSLPTPAPRPFASWDLRELLAALLGEGPRPAGFEDYLPTPSDSYAWRLLELLHAPLYDQGDVVLRCLAGLLGTEVRGLSRDAEGWLGRFADLSAPGFSALGRARWPEGIPVWVSRASDPAPPLLPRDPLLVELRVEPRRGERAGHLVLDVRELLAVVHLPASERRERILATLGAQIPLDRLFDGPLADLSVAWPRDHSWLDDLPRGYRPILVSAPPGYGKSILLQEEARKRGVKVYGPEDELPEEGAVLIDCEAGLDLVVARRLVRSIHWIKDLNAERIIVAARPEVAAALEDVREGFFQSVPLPQWSHAEARQQAQTMLAWGGIQADAPQRYDQLALLSGRNPTALTHLCVALAATLAEAGLRRSFDESQLIRAWRRPELQSRLRALFWDPLEALPGFRAFVEALSQFGALDGRLTWADLIWVISQRDEPVPEERIRWLARILRGYGLIETDERGIGLRPGGPARVLVERLNG